MLCVFMSLLGDASTVNNTCSQNLIRSPSSFKKLPRNQRYPLLWMLCGPLVVVPASLTTHPIIPDYKLKVRYVAALWSTSNSMSDCSSRAQGLHPKLRNTNLHNVTHSLISWNPMERIFVVQISFFVVTFLFLISSNLSLMQIIKEVNPHFHIVPCVMCGVSPSSSSVTCWMLVYAFATSSRKAKWSQPH